jgi:predicted RNA-binding Zn-ribbon protein involved in translation (DUF1610 family)
MSKNDELEISRGGNGTFLCFDDGHTVAQCFCGDEMLHKLKAAPDMYKALKEHMRVFTHDASCWQCSHDEKCDDYWRLQEIADELSMKALGRAEGGKQMSDMKLVVRTEADNYLPVMTVDEAIARRDMMNDYASRILMEGENGEGDYGVLPGTKKKVLYKSGAEKLIKAFGMSARYTVVDKIEDWTGADHGGEPFFYYLIKCSVYRGEKFMGDADGSCNSWEKKYRYIPLKKTCPNCGKPTINRSKDNPSFYCWKKIEGCGATFGQNSDLWRQIEAQPVGQIPDPDICDKVNTFLKMAEKRAFVAVCLNTVGGSEFFTQDMEEQRPQRPTPPHQDTYEAEYRPAEVQESGEVQDAQPAPTVNKAQASALLKAQMAEAGWESANVAMYKEMLLVINPKLNPDAWTTQDFLDAAALPKGELVNCIKAMRVTSPKEPIAT